MNRYGAKLAANRGDLRTMAYILDKAPNRIRALEIAREGILEAIDYYNLSVSDLNIYSGTGSKKTTAFIEAAKHLQVETLKRFIAISEGVFIRGPLSPNPPNTTIEKARQRFIILDEGDLVKIFKFADLRTVKTILKLGLSLSHNTSNTKL